LADFATEYNDGMTSKDLQKRIYDNKVKHNFNLTNVEQEFCSLYGEVGEAYDAWLKKKGKDELGAELADIAIYLYGLAEILHFDLGEEMEKKMAINEKRVYKIVDGVAIKEQKK
jgi:NTP pyrophosphatase (non-canonical NTP hydrolase)